MNWGLNLKTSEMNNPICPRSGEVKSLNWIIRKSGKSYFLVNIIILECFEKCVKLWLSTNILSTKSKNIRKTYSIWVLSLTKGGKTFENRSLWNNNKSCVRVGTKIDTLFQHEWFLKQVSNLVSFSIKNVRLNLKFNSVYFW